MLFLVTHFVEVPSSRVPLSCIVLSDAVKRKSLPAHLKCRMVIPSCGNYSASVWDANNSEELQQWIDANLMDGVAHIAEIPEDFTYGLALELTTSRAADKVATGSKNTLERINNTGARVMETVAEKCAPQLDRLDQRTHLITATREATSAAVDKVKQATDRALESEGVQKSLASLSTSLQNAGSRMGRAFSWVGSKVKETFPSTGGPSPPAYGAFSGDGADPSANYDSAAYSSPVYAMPVSTNAARPSADTSDLPVSGGGGWGTGAGAAPAEEAGPMPHFTLQDEGYSSPRTTEQFGGAPRSGGGAAEQPVAAVEAAKPVRSSQEGAATGAAGVPPSTI